MKEDNENINKIKVFSSDDEKLKILGELLSNKSSRDIIRLLIEKEMYTNEIAKKLELRPNLVIHHLQKMEKIGLLEITNKKIVKKGEGHRFFKTVPNVLISHSTKKNQNEQTNFRHIFKEGIKFFSVGISSVVTWFVTSIILKPNILLGRSGDSSAPMVFEYQAVLTGTTVLIIGLIVLLILEKRKKN